MECECGTFMEFRHALMICLKDHLDFSHGALIIWIKEHLGAFLASHQKGWKDNH